MRVQVEGKCVTSTANVDGTRTGPSHDRGARRPAARRDGDALRSAFPFVFARLRSAPAFVAVRGVGPSHAAPLCAVETFSRDLRISASFSSRVRHTGATWRNGRRLSLSPLR